MKPKIAESTIDRILVQTLTTSNSAAQACLAAAAPACANLTFDRATVSTQVPHLGTFGTADLVLRLWSGDQLQALVLIENKIDAGFTPNQPKRYALCRDAHLAAQAAPFVATLLVSPSIYLEGSRLKDEFDGSLSYEHLSPFVAIAERATIELAIERASSPYEPVPVEAVMSFFGGYAIIATENFPDLRIKTNPNCGDARPEASRTIYFDTRGSGFRAYPFLKKGDKPASIRVSHQCWDSSAPSASVKLMLDGWAVHISTVSPILQSALRGTNLYVRPAGRSLAIVADTKRLDNMQPAEGQRPAIEEALSRIRLIRDVWNGMEEALIAAAGAVQP